MPQVNPEQSKNKQKCQEGRKAIGELKTQSENTEILESRQERWDKNFGDKRNRAANKNRGRKRQM